MIRLITLLVALALLISCSSTRKAGRKLRKADKLIKEAKVLAPSLFDTVYVTKTDTLVLTKDSLITHVKVTVDTVKVDSLLNKLVELKNQGLKTEVITRLIYEEIMPDLTNTSQDSLKIIVEGKERWLRFSTSIRLKDDNLVVVTRPLNDVSYTVETAIVNIDARKKGRFWRGVLFGSIGTFLLILLGWIFRGIISTYLKSIT